MKRGNTMRFVRLLFTSAMSHFHAWEKRTHERRWFKSALYAKSDHHSITKH